ncbi:MAG: hypothetical protein AAF414_07005 [Pseudomonadota bacterium]
MTRNRTVLSLGVICFLATTVLGGSPPATAQSVFEMLTVPQPGDVLATVRVPCEPEDGPHWLVAINDVVAEMLDEPIRILQDETPERGEQFPASSPMIIGVAVDYDNNRTYASTVFSNINARLDLAAPGGSVTDVATGMDAEGLLGQVIDPSDPLSYAPAFCAGTSQAPAVIEGAIIALETVDPEQLRQDLSFALGVIDGNARLTIYPVTLTQPTRAQLLPDVSIGPPE